MKNALLLFLTFFSAIGFAQTIDLPEDPLFAPLPMPGFASFYWEWNSPMDTNVLFDEDGRMVASGQMKDGVPNGVWNSFHPNGKMKWSGTIKGKYLVGDWFSFHSNGKLAARGKMDTVQVELGCAGSENFITMSYFTGKWIFYDSDQHYLERTDYKNGSLSGEYTTFYKNGNHIVEGQFKEGTRNGTWKELYVSGKVKSVAYYAWLPETCRNDEKEDDLDSGWYGYDCRVGLWQWLDESGKVTKEKRYDSEGKLLSN